MPYLRDVVLPECVADFLGPSDALTLTAMAPIASPRAKVCQPLQRKTRVKVKNKTRKQEDLGVAVERGMDSCFFILCLLQSIHVQFYITFVMDLCHCKGLSQH